MCILQFTTTRKETIKSLLHTCFWLQSLPLSNVDSIFSPCLHNQTSMFLQREDPHCYTPPPSLAGRQRWIDDSKERGLLEQWRRPDRLLASLVSLQRSCFNLLFRILSPVLRPKVDKQNQPTSKPQKNPQTRSVRAGVISAFPGDNASWLAGCEISIFFEKSQNVY